MNLPVLSSAGSTRLCFLLKLIKFSALLCYMQFLMLPSNKSQKQYYDCDRELRENASVGIWGIEGGSGGTWDQATFVGGMDG